MLQQTSPRAPETHVGLASPVEPATAKQLAAISPKPKATSTPPGKTASFSAVGTGPHEVCNTGAQKHISTEAQKHRSTQAHKHGSTEAGIPKQHSPGGDALHPRQQRGRLPHLDVWRVGVGVDVGVGHAQHRLAGQLAVQTL